MTICNVDLSISSPVGSNELGDIHLTVCVNGEVINDKNLIIRIEPFYEYTQEHSSVAFDLLLISIVVYNIDRLISRNVHSADGWKRKIKIVGMPVNNLSDFYKTSELIDDCLSFLSGDEWTIDYVDINSYQFFRKVPQLLFPLRSPEKVDKVCLLSGGMDSLIGAIDLLAGGEKVLFSSHYDLGAVDKEQLTLIKTIREHYSGQFEHIQGKVGLGQRSKDKKGELEATFRSRSLLFLAQAIYLAFNTNENTEVIVPENGTISLNIPLTRSRRSSCSTRTTHPTFIKKLNNILKELGINNQIRNPYEFKTKGEMIAECVNKKLLYSMIFDSVSCAKKGHSKYWDKAMGSDGKKKSHCGMCMPCFYRRAALHYAELDQEALEQYGTDVLHPQDFDINNRSQKRSADLRALCQFIRNIPNTQKIEKNLIINGFEDLEKIKEYSDVISRSYKQVKDWLTSSENEEIQKHLS